MDDISNYEKLKEDAVSFYSGIKKIFSPALKEEIVFSAEGFNFSFLKSFLDFSIAVFGAASVFGQVFGRRRNAD